MLGLIGEAVGENWEEWRDHLHYLDYAVLAGILVVAAYLLVRRRRGGGPGAPPEKIGELERSG
jgi:hypothetical protein